MKVHILDDWSDALRGLAGFKRLEGHDVTVWTDAASDEDELVSRVADAEALVLFRERTRITESLVSRLPGLRLVSQRSGYPHVDVAALTRHGVVFSSGKGQGAPSSAAAELAFALILVAARRLPEQIASARSGQWQAGADLGESVFGKRLGLVGHGRLGKQVAHYARAFGMDVVWWGSEAGRARAASEGETVASDRAAFWSSCDVISLHQRLVPETRGAVTRDDLLAMKPTAILINTARAGLIAPGALLEALEAGRPGLAALDVFDGEPVNDPDDPILSHPRVIPTPHIGFVTSDELDLQFSEIYDQINAFAAGAPINVINPEVLCSQPGEQRPG